MKPFVAFRENIHGKYIFRLYLLKYHLFIMQRVVCKFCFKTGFPGFFKNENFLTFSYSLSFGFKCWCWRVDVSLFSDSLWSFSLYSSQELLSFYMVFWYYDLHSPLSTCLLDLLLLVQRLMSFTSVAFSSIIY